MTEKEEKKVPLTRAEIVKTLVALKYVEKTDDRELIIDELIESVKDLTATVFDPGLEIAALKDFAQIHGIPEERMNTLMKLPYETLANGLSPDKFREALVEHVCVEGEGHLDQVVAEIALIGAGVHSLFRKLIVDTHPEIAREPVFEVRAVTLEEYREMQKKGIIKGTKKKDEENVVQDPDCEIETESGYTSDGTECWRKDEKVDVV